MKTARDFAILLAFLAFSCGPDFDGARRGSSAGGAETTSSRTAVQPSPSPNPNMKTNFSIHEPIRVVTLGDSLAYGAGDEQREGIAGRLEDELRRRGITSEVTNHGVNGAQTADLLARLK